MNVFRHNPTASPSNRRVDSMNIFRGSKQRHSDTSSESDLKKIDIPSNEELSQDRLQNMKVKLRTDTAHKLDLTSTNIDEKEAKNLSSLISNNSSKIHMVKFSQSVISGADMKMLVETLVGKKCGVSVWKIVNTEISEVELMEVVKIIMGSKEITKLCLKGTQLGPKSVPLLVNLIANNKSLTSLKIEDCNIGSAINKFLNLLYLNMTLTTLHLGNIGYDGDKLAQQMAGLLQANDCLTEIAICHTSLQPTSVDTIIGGALFSRPITMLSLAYTEMDLEGLTVLCKSIDQNVHLQELDISGNPLGEGWSEIVSTSLQHNEVLLRLKIRDCNLTTGLSNVIKGTKIQFLDAANNPWSLEELKYLGEALKTAMSLTHLSLRGCGVFGIPEIGAFAGGLVVNNSLQSIDLRDLGLSNEAGSELLWAIESNLSLKQILIQGNTNVSQDIFKAFENRANTESTLEPFQENRKDSKQLKRGISTQVVNFTLEENYQQYTNEDLSQMLDLIVEGHMEDPHWVYVCKESVLRRKLMKVVFSSIVQWCTKHSAHIYVRRDQITGAEDSSFKRIRGVSVWIPPEVVVAVSTSRLMMALSKVMFKIGGGVATRLKSMLLDIEDFINTNNSKKRTNWELIYCEVHSSLKECRGSWDDIVSVVFNENNKKQLSVWTYTTDPARVKWLQEWGFEINCTGLISKKIDVWGLIRKPNLE